MSERGDWRTEAERAIRTAACDHLPALAGDLARLGAVLQMRLSERADAATDAGPDDRLLTVDEAAEVLKVKPGWLYRHADRLPFTRKLSRKMLRFSERGVQSYLATHRR